MVLVYVLMAAIGAAVAVFALQNLDPVVIRFLTWRIEGMPLALVIVASLVGGMVLAWAASVAPYVRLRARVRHLERQLDRATAPPARADTAPDGPSPGARGG